MVVIAVIVVYFAITKDDNVKVTGSVEIKFEPRSDILGENHPLRIYNDNGELITEKLVVNINDIIMIDNLRAGNYIAKIEGLCPPGYNEKKFTIISTKTTKIDLFVRICI